MKYHVNPQSGQPGICTASTRCPFGGDEAHGDTEAEALAAHEARMASGHQNWPVLQKAPVTFPNTSEEQQVAWALLSKGPNGWTDQDESDVDMALFAFETVNSSEMLDAATSVILEDLPDQHGSWQNGRVKNLADSILANPRTSSEALSRILQAVPSDSAIDASARHLTKKSVSLAIARRSFNTVEILDQVLGSTENYEVWEAVAASPSARSQHLDTVLSKHPLSPAVAANPRTDTYKLGRIAHEALSSKATPTLVALASNPHLPAHTFARIAAFPLVGQERKQAQEAMAANTSTPPEVLLALSARPE